MCNVYLSYSGGIHHKFMNKERQNLKQRSPSIYIYLSSRVYKVGTQFNFSCLLLKVPGSSFSSQFSILCSLKSCLLPPIVLYRPCHCLYWNWFLLKSGPFYCCYPEWAETNVKNLLLHRTFTEDKVLMFLQIQRSLSLLSIEINIYFYINCWIL